MFRIILPDAIPNLELSCSPPPLPPLLLRELYSHVDTAVLIKSMCLDHEPDKKLALMKRKLRLITNMTDYRAYD